jgi:hypothetical protein
MHNVDISCRNVKSTKQIKKFLRILEWNPDQDDVLGSPSDLY